MNKTIGDKHGLLAISPLVVFMIIYLVSSLLCGDFYKIPTSASFMLAIAYAIIIMPKTPFAKRITLLSKGASDENIITMIWIFILAGAFSACTKEIGAVDATVNLTLNVVPGRLLYAGLFFAACFVSFAMGTSVGTVVTLVPMTTELAAQTGISLPFVTGIVVGGAFFGDNLSFISDTTIAATRTQQVQMTDKFKLNFKIVLPAAILVLIGYAVVGSSQASFTVVESIDWIKILPYILIIILSVCRVHVVISLAIGILSAVVIGFVDGSLDWTTTLVSMGNGVSSMGELIVVTLLAGGLLALIKYNGGLDYMVDRLSAATNGKRGAQFSIAALVSIANICTANNTIAIITTGEIAKKISVQYGIDPRKTASILDTFSCFIQSIIPYGAQMLMAGQLAGISAISIIPHMYYTFAMCIFAIFSLIRIK
ncbi:MAG: Na+/H+ antiporter NhaC family protein [Bacteroidales bacterium]|nr:Na+/H+ antiporter NhaC family protein [Bacteroidales bacterium]